jgi:hypothetical protein
VPQHQLEYRYVGLFIIEILKHSSTIFEYITLEYLKNVYEIIGKYNKLQADNNNPTRCRIDKISYYDFSLWIKMIQNLILV